MPRPITSLRIAFAFVPAALALMTAAPARADFVIETATTGPAQLTTDFLVPLALAKFDSSLGTLQDVVISYSDASTMNGTVTNTSASSQTFTVTESTAFDLALGSTTLLSNSLSASQSYTLLAPFQAGTFGGFTPSGSAGPLVLTSGATFDAFAHASGDVIVDFSTLTTTRIVGGGGNLTAGIYTTAGATVAVRYDYDAIHVSFNSVPEPSSVAMTALGGLLAGATGLARRSRRGRGA